jgi:predicted metal-dependent phosphoesterase TrpH
MAVSFLIDMHTHTSDASACASQTADELIARAEEVGLGGVVVTDHNLVEGALKAERLARRRGSHVKVFVGVEVQTEELGDVLVYGLRESFPDAPVPMRRLARAAERAGALMFAAHPFRRHARNALWAYLEETGFRWRHEMALPELVRPLAGVEIYNGGATPAENEEASMFAARFRLKGIAGSDSHNPWRVGWCATTFEFDIRDEAELIQALRLNRFSVTRRQSEFASDAERREHIDAMSSLRGRQLSEYVVDWRRRKPHPR